MNGLLQDLRYAFRGLTRNPGLAVIAALSLAIGIGANSAIFSVADAEFLRPLPVRDPGSVVTISTSGPDDRGSLVSYPNYRDLREQTQSFEGLVAYRRATLVSFARSRRDVRETRLGMLVSDNFFSVLGIQPGLGRLFTPEEGVTVGRDAVIVLGYDFWKNALGGDPSVVNSIVWINGIAFTVVGVTPAEFTGMDESLPAFFAPIAMSERIGGAPENLFEDRDARWFAVKGRLKPGVSSRRAQAELAALWKGLEEQQHSANSHLAIAVRSQLQERIHEEGPATVIAIGMMMALVAIVLIIACANVASLMLGRARARSREMAIRLALGVSRMRLLRQLLVESLMLALTGGALGLVFAQVGIRLLHAIPSPAGVRAVIAPQLDARVLLVSLLAAAASAVLCGLAPAWQSLRTQLVPNLKNTEFGQMTRHRTVGRNVLVVGQIALAMVLLVVTVVLLDGFRQMLIIDPGFRTDHLIVMNLDTSTGRYTPSQTRAFYRQLEDRARTLPGVVSAALTSSVALDRGGDIHTVLPEGYSLPQGRESVTVFSANVDEHYFDTMKTELIRGRAFTADDTEDSRRVAVVNEEFAKMYWPNQDPIGKRLRLNDSEGPWLEVVGLTKTGKYLYLAEPPTPFLYLPFSQQERAAMSLLVETTSSDASPIAAPLRDAVRDLDVNQPVVSTRTLADLYEQRAILVPLRLLQLVGAMGSVGLTLALIGIYGLVAYSVARRTREIGLRIAIGAGTSDVLTMVLRQGLGLSSAGVLVGGVLSAGVVRVLASGMSGLGAPNPAIYVLVPVLLILLTMAACYFPARRASRIDPLRALRQD